MLVRSATSARIGAETLVLRARAALRRRRALARDLSRERARFYEDVWRDAASELGAKMTPLADGSWEIRLANRRVVVHDQNTPIDSASVLKLAGDKPAVLRRLLEAGLPVTEFLEFERGNPEPAWEFIESLGRPCVVKPARDTGGGDGVTTGVSNRRDLRRAMAAAAVHGPRLLIEEQLAGDTYRILSLDGEILDAVRRRPPCLLGDGRSSIIELVRRENAARIAARSERAQTPLTIDSEMKNALASQGWTLADRPPPGAIVRAKNVANQNSRDDNEPAASELCQAIREAAVKAAALLGARLAGVDMILRDPGLPLSPENGVILEVNTTPGFHYHYRQRGPAAPVARAVLRTLLAESLASPDGAKEAGTREEGVREKGILT